MKSQFLGKKYVIGIDEAGRGPLAGPLAVGFVMMDCQYYESYQKSKRSIPKGKDSKKLTEKQREEWFFHIKEDKNLAYKVIFVNEKNIDKKGLSASLREAISKGLAQIGADKDTSILLLDGGLKGPAAYAQRTIIKGDEREKIISLASVAAKVSRDRLMLRLSKKYPLYGFDRHKGYGTKEHRQILKNIGPCSIHRLTFCRNLIALRK